MKPSILVALLVGAAVGFVVGHATGPTSSGPSVARNAPNSAANAPKLEDSSLYKVVLGDAPVRGSADALVTIVEFSDFQCPFCGRANGTLEALQKQYGNKIRLVMKQNPLDFHPHARPAALAALAAGEQGKFWEMYDLLFAHQTQLESSDFENYAQQAGVDLARWKADLNNPQLAARIQRDLAQGSALGVNATPAFFINGRKLVGAQPIDAFRAVIDSELVKAEALVKRGTPANRVYDAAIASGIERAPVPVPTRPQAPPQGPVVRKVEIPPGAATFGPKHAKVTIVEFSDFQCPFCGRAAPAVEQIRKAFPKDVEIVFRNFPLSMHPNAHIAAQAAVAAQKQGKFWELHDLLFANQTALGHDQLFGYAKQIGLNMKKFEADFGSAETNAQIAQDLKDGAAVGVNGTPYFYVNGHQQIGAMPFEQFKGVIEAEIQKANKLLASGVKMENLYDKLVEQAQAQAPTQAAAPAAAGPVKAVEIGQAPVLGPKTAPVTIVEFSDFQCPYCGRAFNTLKEVEAQYKGKIKVAFKNEPLSMHPYARIAATAALAARDQGKFWEMHDLLFTHQTALDRPSLEKYAQELKLDMVKFRAALDGNQYERYLQEDTAQAAQLGVNATPTFFVNGQELVGPTPEQLKAAIDQELAKVARK